MPQKLAIDGGTPVRENLLPYARQNIDENDIEQVVRVLQSDWLTTGPEVALFEKALAKTCGAAHAVAVNNGTAALHTAMRGAGVQLGDEVLVPAITFAASANAIAYRGADPVFCDVEDDTLLIDPAEVETKLTGKTRAVVAVDYTGQPCDYDLINQMAHTKGAKVIADAAHSLGGEYGGRPVGSLADITILSFHPAKHITTGEGGAVITDDAEADRLMRIFRNHGIDTDLEARQKKQTWNWDLVDLGHNYRLTDFQSALGRSQLGRLPGWVRRRRELAGRMHAGLAEIPGVNGLAQRPGRSNSYHMFIARLESENLRVDRDQVFRALRAEGIGANVHYSCVHLHPMYQERYGTGPGMCPRAEKAAREILTLPMFPAMSDKDADDVIEAMAKVVGAYLA